MRHSKLLILAAFLTAVTGSRGLANDTTFTYQGSLKDGGAPADGFYDMTFRLYSAVTGGSLLGVAGFGVQVDDGVFTAELDFGANDFNNTDRWLEIIVNGTTLSPRQPITRSPYAIQTRGIFVSEEGNVGIGSTLAAELLTLRGPDANLLMLSQGNDFGPKMILRNTASGISTVHGTVSFEDSNPRASIGYVKPFIGPDGLQLQSSNSLTTLKLTDNGTMGINNLSPEAPLHVTGWILTDGPSSAVSVRNPNNVTASVTLGWHNDVSRIRIGGEGAGAAGGLDIQRTANVSLMRILHNGNVGLGTTNPTAKLHVNGNARVNVLEVTGADLAERFPTSGGSVIEPGMVVEFDPEMPGSLRLASGAYSRLVAGVVSGANGLPAGTVMGNLPGSENSPAIALTGRVWVQCDASVRGIETGDLLTTSSTPGHAMSVTDHERAMGSVIGKAITGLERGESGMVLVLVGLQ